ncbi:polyprenol monophosphomannose synthase [Desulfurococcaceae archaeon MEX13E-LK6-19]|nr:polyprenol monophosphomannose synthase [Desulfurococcaceae archaeon MEX13E-LK6-19]
MVCECVSIIIPTYNERENVKELIPLIASIANNNGIKYEIIVVDDDSPDKTWEVAKEYEDKYNVKVFVRRGERGLSSAIIYGAKNASCPCVVVMDADFQHPPEKIPDIVDLLNKGCDVVVASRYTKGGGVEGWSKLRYIESKVATIIARIFLPPVRKISDPMSGFFGARRELLLNPDIRPMGYKILIEVIVKNPSVKVCETPYVFRSRRKGKSKLGKKTIFEYLIQVLLDAIYIVKNKIRKQK